MKSVETGETYNDIYDTVASTIHRFMGWYSPEASIWVCRRERCALNEANRPSTAWNMKVSISGARLRTSFLGHTIPSHLGDNYHDRGGIGPSYLASLRSMNHTRDLCDRTALTDITEAQICHITWWHQCQNSGGRFDTSHRRSGWYGTSKHDTTVKMHWGAQECIIVTPETPAHW